MKKHSFSILAALLVVFPAMLNAQEYDVPQTPPAVEPETVVVPETVVAPETVAAPEVTVQDETVAEAPAEEVKAKKEKKVKEKKVKEPKAPKAPKVKEVREEKKEKSYGLFNHLGIGVSAGLMDGLTANVGLPIGGHFAIRGGYNFLSSVYSYKTNLDLGSWELDNSTKLDLSNIPVKADITMQYYGMIDFYLSKKGAFHITAGLFGGDGEILHGTADLTGVQQLSKEDYAKTSISYKEANEPGHISVSTDPDGFVHAGLRANKTLMPYFGIGWGRVCNLKKWMSLSLDLGLLKTGGFEVYARDYKLKQDSAISSATVDHKDSFDFTGKPIVGKYGQQDDLIDKAKNGELPLLKDFLPCIKIGLNIRLF
jgi:hypothetical protein